MNGLGADPRTDGDRRPYTALIQAQVVLDTLGTPNVLVNHRTREPSRVLLQKARPR